MEKVFSQILDKDEKVVEVLKPNKVKYFVKNILLAVLCVIIMVVPFCLGEAPDSIDIWIPITIGLIFVLIWIIFIVLNYLKTFYAYTNKRIVIRTGIIGVDFKSLDMKMIGAIDVNVSLLDKLLRKNTGTLKYGSMSSPINNQTSTYVFAHISNPYENYKKIKECIDDCKEKKNEN